MTEPAVPPAARGAVDPLERYEARVLDPSTAVRLAGAAPAATAYCGDILLITAGTRDFAAEVIAALAAVADRLGLAIVGPDVFEQIDSPDPRDPEVLAHNRFARLMATAEQSRITLVVPVRFGPAGTGPAPAIDVWPLLQAFRDSTTDSRLLDAVALDHLMFAAPVIGGNPFSRGWATIGGSPFSRGWADIGGSPFSRGWAAGVGQYLAGGSGGHGPVSVVLAPPRRDPDACSPHVVVLDTGVGEHPWFTVDPVAARMKMASGDDVGLDVDDAAVKATDPEGEGAVPDPLTGLLASHAGHGTFISGLLRQTCPDARLTALRIMSGDGVVAEHELTDPLTGLTTLLDEQPGSVDALVLSLGYYAETDDADYTAGLKDLLVGLSARGVVTFVAAGNDSTDRRSYPAAFADHYEFAGDDVLPLVAVAALNPDLTVALFSNDADWVNAEAPGANVVSTAPVLASGAWSADTALVQPDGQPRGTIDPDSFSSGFATWSGTSFAAPVLAGRFAAALSAAGCPTDSSQRRALVPLRPPALGSGGASTGPATT